MNKSISFLIALAAMIAFGIISLVIYVLTRPDPTPDPTPDPAPKPTPKPPQAPHKIEVSVCENNEDPKHKFCPRMQLAGTCGTKAGCKPTYYYPTTRNLEGECKTLEGNCRPFFITDARCPSAGTLRNCQEGGIPTCGDCVMDCATYPKRCPEGGYKLSCTDIKYNLQSDVLSAKCDSGDGKPGEPPTMINTSINGNQCRGEYITNKFGKLTC